MEIIRIIIALLLAFIIIGCVFLLLNKKNKGNNKIRNKLSEEEKTAYTDFDLKFLKMENNEKNIIYSPLSTKYALYMLRDGAKGRTLEQIENALVDANKVTKYNSIENVLAFANGIIIKNSYKGKIRNGYIRKIRKNYNAEVKYYNLDNSIFVNSWIEDKTLGQIKQILDDSSVQETEVLLINALAIDMEWEEKFSFVSTSGSIFYLNNGEEIYATTMYNKTKSDSTSYFEDENVISISMDLMKYKNQQLTFIAVMPKNEKLTEYIENFKISQLENIENNFKSAAETEDGVIVKIPKFSYDYKLDFKKDLEKLGIEDAFNMEMAEFTQMSNDKLYLRDAIHKANIKFSEEGVKAAAVTIKLMATAGAMYRKEEPVRIYFDKPFMYLIKDKESGEIWFVGTVYEPNKWENDAGQYRGK